MAISTEGAGVGVPLIVFTDLDGTLLDERSYSYAPAWEALSALAAAGTPLVLCSSKTRHEMQVLVEELGLAHPFIVENGGAVVLPASDLRQPPPGALARDGRVVVPIGTASDRLIAALPELAKEAGTEISGFHEWSDDEVVALTRLPGDAVWRARQREYDEPFRLADERALPRVADAAARRGLRVTRGGRFHHLTGETDKGRGVRTLLGLYAAEGRTFTSVALGDALNDAPMLLAVDRPIVVPRPDGTADAALAGLVPDAELAPAPGPEGWNHAVLTVLGGGRLPAVSRAAAGDA